MAELVLNDADRMLDPCPDHRDDAVGPFVQGMQRAARGGLAHDTPDLARPGEGGLARGIDVALVGQTETSSPCSSASQT